MTRRIIIVLILFFAGLHALAQQDIFLHLKINDKQKLAVYHDEPLLLSLSISNPKASEDEQWNRSASYQYAALDKALHDQKISEEKWKEEKQKLDKQKKETQSIQIGSENQPAWDLFHFSISDKNGKPVDSVSIKFLDSADAPRTMMLDANAYYLFYWGIDRACMRRLKPGTYFVSMQLKNYISSVIELTIKSSSIPTTLLQSKKIQYQLGSFALQYGNADTAIYHAKKILKTEPSSIDGLVLLGDAYTHKKNYNEALKQFESALKNFNRQYPLSPEPPQYITSMIDWLKKQSM